MNAETADARHAIPDDTPIWRYMDMARFVALLTTKTLWFAKAAQFHDDPFEGFCRVTPLPPPQDEYGEVWLSARTDGESKPVSVERMVAELVHCGQEYFENPGEHLYVNSWCLADESMAMWQIYGANGCGIALKSSVGRYQRAIDLEQLRSQFAFGRVEYHNDLEGCVDLHLDFRYGVRPMPGIGVWKKMLPLAFHKRTCFEHEREWRGALYQDARPAPGCDIEADLNELVEAVHVGPRAPDFLFDAVKAVMDKFDLQRPLERSALLQPPRRNSAAC